MTNTTTFNYCPDCGGKPCLCNDPNYQAYCEEQEAIHSGNATELTHCYLCYLETTGKADMSPKQDQGPLRGILRHTTTPGPDPYDCLHLSCGHAII